MIAKLKYDYPIGSAENTENANDIAAWLSSKGYVRESILGILGNIQGESGMNPWRWQDDQVRAATGYGLFQFTPATYHPVNRTDGYINNPICTVIEGYAPSRSVDDVQQANVSDAYAQLTVFNDDILQKWNNTCWVSKWSKTTYAAEWAQAQHILATYGSNNRLSLAQFSKINNIDDAVLAFLACYEQPEVPNTADRVTFAHQLEPYVHILSAKWLYMVIANHKVRKLTM